MPAATTASTAAGQGNIDNPLQGPGNNTSKTSNIRRSVNQSRGDIRGTMASNTAQHGAVAAGDQNPVRNAELQNYVVNKIELLKRTQFNIKKLNQLCSFIPDFILLDEINRKIPYQLSHEAVVLMADVSGFTALTEAYSLRGKGGTDQLTKTLAGYIGPLAECILQADGDIIKYAGDAILAFWKTSQDDYPEDVQRAIDCALFIQEKYGSYLCKDVDITIKVKIGIGAGTAHMCGIGTEAYQHWVVFGPGVAAASEGEKHCNSGDVVVHEAAWAHCSPANYKFSMRDTNFYLMHDIVNFINYEKRGRPAQLLKTGFLKVPNLKKESMMPVFVTDMEKIRPHITLAVDRKPEVLMRPFVIPPVLRKLDDDIPLEYLNESRVVCICFIHVKTDEKIDADEKNFRENMATIVQRGFVKIYQNVTKLQGALSKVIMFDKGLTYLVVFGLPGYINENQSAHALKFAYRTRLALKSIRGVTDCSIGVTTGSCYCGVIGHQKRQEYTVIGRKVNKAARLMVYYPGRLTCDQDTAYFSKLPLENFKLMEAKELKGIKDVGKIYEFVNADSSDDNSIPFFQYPMLGREAELSYFKSALQRTKKELANISTQYTMGGTLIQRALGVGGPDLSGNQKGIWMIIFEGDNGIGKSRMLGACIHEAEKMNIRVFTVGMTLASSSQAHFAISCLVIEALGMLELRTVPEREDYLRKHVTDADLAADLCLLNEILHTKFPLNPKYTAMDVNTCHTIGQHVLASLLRVTYPEDLILFVVDDAHLMDSRSWEYLVYVSKSPNVFALCSLRRSNAGSPKLQDSVTKQIYHNKNIKIIRISGLAQQLLLPLACQVMHVKAIPVDLEKLIINKSNGVPAWIDQVLKELIRVQIIRFEKDTYNKQPMAAVDRKHLEKMKKAPKKSFRRWAQEDNDDNIRYANAGNDAFSVRVSDVNLKEEINPLERVLVIKSDTNIHSVPVSGTLKEILLDAYDELNPNEQIILKAATVLGLRFSRQMLTRLLPSYEMWARKYDQGFNSLLEAKYFRCASGTAKQKEASSAINAKPECFCRDDEFTAFIGAMEQGGTSVEKRPKYYSCRFLEFMKENMVEVVYDVMTEDQKAEFHLKAAKYLDSSIIRCESCGGEDRSYLFGFVRKQNDYTVDTEEALRVSGNSRRRSSSRPGAGGDMGLAGIPHQGKHHATFETQLEGLRKTFEQGGTKVGNIELDIMRTLMDFDKNENQLGGCCCFRRAKAKEIAEEEAEINRFEASQELTDQIHGEAVEGTTHMSLQAPLVPPDGGSRRPSISGSFNHQPQPNLHTHSMDHHYHQMHESQNQPTYSMVDLRTCQCAVLQAKICVEMVFHYREAKKYGRCLQNLLDAAESDVTVGNGTQALVHIEDALGLLIRVKDGDLPSPDKDDQDDATIDEKEAEAQIEFLSGLAYFEIGVNTKAREFFLKALHRLGLKIHYDESGVRRESSILGAKMRLWRSHACSCFYRKGNANSNDNDDTWRKKIRILSYLHSLFKNEKKIEMALLVTIWQVIIAEQHGEIVHDIIPAYANMMDIYSALSKHRDAKRYEHYALEMIRSSVGSDSQIEPLGLITSANLFLSVAIIRLSRGEIESSSSAAYLALRIAQTIHDNALTIRVLPLLCQTLLLSLRITEIAEALQKLWFLAEESDDWTGVSNYYAICLDLLLNTAYPLEHFGVCENFITNSDWTAETNMFRDIETQYSMECSLALWYARYSRWEQSQKWLVEAEAHKPKYHSFSTVNSDLKLLECQLIFVNHYLDSKRYQHFAKARNAAKELMRTLTKATKVVPVLKPRFTHLMAYYYRVRSRNVEAEKQLKMAEKMAEKMGNNLEQEWLIHSRTVWADLAIPTIKYFWLEHTEAHTLDWHSSGKIPWANIMFSLPLPAWK